MTDPTSKSKSSRTQRLLRIIAILVLAILLAKLGQHFWHSKNKSVPTPSRQQNCDLHQQACTVLMKDGKSVTLEVSPKSIPLGKPIALKVTLKKIQPKNVSAILTALKSGRSSSTINLTPKRNNSYTGSVTLRKTSDPKQRWMILVVINTEELNIAVPYKFYISQ